MNIRFSRNRARLTSCIATAAAAAMVLGISGCGSDSDSRDGTLRVATIPGVSSLPVQVAIEKGFFADHGVEVEVTAGLDVAAWQSAVGKQFDIVLSNAGVYTQSADKGLHNTLVNNMVDADDDYAQNSLAAKDPIEDFADLRGATIGVPTLTGLVTQATQYLLHEAGLTPDDYKLVTMPYSSQADNLAAGNVDAVLTAKPYEEALKRAGYAVGPRDVCVQALKTISGGKVATCSSVVFAANSEWAQQHSEDLDAWIAGLEDAVDFIADDPEEAADILQKWVGYSDELIDDVELPDYSFGVPEDQLEAAWQILVANGAVEGDFPSKAVSVWKG